MSNLTSLDWWVGLYFVASGVAVAFTVGQSLVKLLLLRFASRKRIDDTLWCLGSGVWGAMEPKTNVRKISTHFIE